MYCSWIFAHSEKERALNAVSRIFLAIFERSAKLLIQIHIYAMKTFMFLSLLREAIRYGRYHWQIINYAIILQRFSRLLVGTGRVRLMQILLPASLNRFCLCDVIYECSGCHSPMRNSRQFGWQSQMRCLWCLLVARWHCNQRSAIAASDRSVQIIH
jgi:hypothetical protein